MIDLNLPSPTTHHHHPPPLLTSLDVYAYFLLLRMITVNAEADLDCVLVKAVGGRSARHGASRHGNPQRLHRLRCHFRRSMHFLQRRALARRNRPRDLFFYTHEKFYMVRGPTTAMMAMKVSFSGGKVSLSLCIYSYYTIGRDSPIVPIKKTHTLEKKSQSLLTRNIFLRVPCARRRLQRLHGLRSRLCLRGGRSRRRPPPSPPAV